MKTVLTIAGFDPSSGAGVTADLMVFAAHGLFGISCVTALTVQSTLGVRGTYPVEAEVVRATLECLAEDLPPVGIKIGMLGTVEVVAAVAAVAAFVEARPGVPVVLDPVIRSSSGRELLSAEGVMVMRERLLPLVTVVTPNLEELAALTGGAVRTREEMVEAAGRLQTEFPGLNVVATGGHLDRPDDLVLGVGGAVAWLPGERVATTSTHGTGCAFSSALLSRLVAGNDLVQAAGVAKEYVAGALRRAERRGGGWGPMNLLWPLAVDAAEMDAEGSPNFGNGDGFQGECR